ncbi:MAG: hypothetical protein KJN67_05460, partial [Pontiella sp.]|nr:hypothetical protein [Pontiella sp.]
MVDTSTDKYYGGFLEFETGLRNTVYHKNALALSHGRACLAYILDQEKPRVVHAPFYTCGAMIDPIEERGIEIVYYNIDNALDPVGLPESVGADELVIYINYFGLKSNTMERLTNQYDNRLVADNCMAFYSRQYGNAYTYNSCRKFFGVPDGSYLYTPTPMENEFKRYEGYRLDHLISRLRGDMDICYGQYLENEEAFDCNIYAMSALTERLMSTFDYDGVAERRHSNYLYIHERIGKYNRLQLLLEPMAVPHYYPLFVAEAPDRRLLAKERLFIPALWPDMLSREASGFDHEIDLA